MFGKSEQVRAEPFAYEILDYMRPANARDTWPLSDATVRALI
jgi:hypothetical protein